MNQKYYLGIDLHRDSFTAYGTDQSGSEVVKNKYGNSHESIDQVLTIFPTPPAVVVEATQNWMWLAYYFQEKGCFVNLAHPLKLKAIATARIKTDILDAKTLCHLLRSGMIPQSYIASCQEFDNREIIRARSQFVADQTRIKNRIMAHLAKENLRFRGTDLFGKTGREWLTKQTFLPAREKVITLALQELERVQMIIKELDKEVKQRGGNSPEVSYLTSIPSVGAITAFTIVAEVGDVTRFPTASHFTSYLGLVPQLSQSGNHSYYGRITKLGSSKVRRTLIQTAHRIVRSEEWARAFVNRLSYRCGKKKAIVALSRKLAVIIYHLLKERRRYINNYSQP